MRPKDISIIIPVSSAKWYPYLANCLKSIAIQFERRDDYEIVIAYMRPGTKVSVPNPMDEETLQEQRAFDDLCSEFGANVICHVHSKKDYPLALNRNIGARRATKKYLAFIDCDLILDPDTFVAAQQQVPKVGSAAHCLVYRMNKRLVPDHSAYEKIWDDRASFQSLWKCGELETSGRGGFFYISRKLFYSIRGYDERMVGWGGEDDDLYTRLTDAGHRIVHLSPECGIYAVHQWHRHKPQYRQRTDKNWEKWRTASGLVRNVDDGWGGEVD